MRQKAFQINAFSSELFSGNPSLVVPLGQWFDDSLMQKIATESGLTCAFFVGANGDYRIRWFTPRAEIEGICGHGTLAAGYVILDELRDTSDEVVFHVPAGDLRVRRMDGHYVLDLPALNPTPRPRPKNLKLALGQEPEAVFGALDFIAVFSAEQDVIGFEPNLSAMADLPLRAVIITASGRDVDFVSRWFMPKNGGGEDTGITGSGHCSLVPYWADRLRKTTLTARQLSPRGGRIDCKLNGNRVYLSCMAVKYMEGILYL
jgi:PhzF family phenazine biosynthesis protein